MRFWGLAFALGWIGLISLHAHAQPANAVEKAEIRAAKAFTWNDGRTSIVQLSGNVRIRLDRSNLTANEAVIWMTRAQDTLLDEQQVHIVLLGNANLRQPDITRSGEKLLVSATLRGNVQLLADERAAQDQSKSTTYQAALQLRPLEATDPAARIEKPSTYLTRRWQAPAPMAPQMAAATQPVRPEIELNFKSGKASQTKIAGNGKAAIVLGGGILITYRNVKGDYLEFLADSAVLFTNTEKLEDLVGDKFADKIDAVYLEGDVRANVVPADPLMGEQRMTANRIYYELATDRAILTDAVMHTVDPLKQIPIFIRAETLRKLSEGEYRVSNGQLATSGMINPSYALATEKLYVRESDSGDPRVGKRTTYSADNVTLRAWGWPVFYLPWAGGTIDQGGQVLRNLSVGKSTNFGFGTEATLGMFELAGQPRPADVDARLKLGYFDTRGPTVGLDGEYSGGFISETTKKPWNFQGDFQSYMVHDKGEDILGRGLEIVPPDETRGTFLWQHQHFFPDDWQAQIRIGYVSDATFLEQWFPKDYDNGLPRDMSLYLKRQRNTEAFTFFVNAQPSDVVTTAEYVQEQFEVEHLPELGYHRVGDSFAGDSMTFFSSNTVGGYAFDTSDASLAEQGFLFGNTPGLPSVGKSGVTNDTVYRGDFREEVDFPFSTAHFRWVPYVFGRYTVYSDSPGGGSENRMYAGAGARITTQFWGVDDSARSDLFDIHRLRHVIEPQLNVYTSAQSLDQDKVFNYEEQVDQINDVSAVQLALHQRWQTKRGGPGRWRSVDFFTLNVEGNFFSNQPSDPLLNPTNFRGLFFATMPEASVPRNSINADSTWRVTDTTVIVSDAQMNLDESQLATASIGLALQRSDRVAFFLGNRYIEELKTNITSAAMDYQINEKYLLSLAQSFDFGQQENVSYNFGMTRKFDRFFFKLNFSFDQTTNDTGVSFVFLPYGLNRGIGATSSQLESK